MPEGRNRRVENKIFAIISLNNACINNACMNNASSIEIRYSRRRGRITAQSGNKRDFIWIKTNRIGSYTKRIACLDRTHARKHATQPFLHTNERNFIQQTNTLDQTRVLIYFQSELSETILGEILGEKMADKSNFSLSTSFFSDSVRIASTMPLIVSGV